MVQRVELEHVADQLQAMRKQEDTIYSYRQFQAAGSANPRLNSSWREKICQWSFNVVDHFDLSREIVAVSLNLFDRYLATQGNKCNGNKALLTSLTTLYIAIKIHEPKQIKLGVLANLSRGQFGPQDIEAMEWKVLAALGWKLHPPTEFTFVSLMLMFLPPETPSIVKKGLEDFSRYLTELAVCDSYFVNIKNSTIAFAVILNVMEDMRNNQFTPTMRAKFLANLAYRAGVFPYTAEVVHVRERLRRMYEMALAANGMDAAFSQTYHGPDYNGDSTSIADASIMSASTHGSYKSFISDSKGSCRYSSTSPLRRRLVNTVSPISRAARSSPMVAGVP